MRYNPSWLFYKFFLIYALPLVLLILGLGFVGMDQAQKNQLSLLEQSANEKVISAKASAIQDLNLVVRDVKYLANSLLLNNVVNASNSPSLNATRSKALDAKAKDWQSLMVASPIYDQIRWIDEFGQERLRINQTPLLPMRLSDTELQNKSDRYYFSKAMLLGKEQFYFSPFDLNVERGVIETPRKPMIRVTKPVFDDQGQNKGVIVLNYLGNGLLSRLNTLNDERSQALWLTNEQGYWLLGNTPEEEWGFMYDRSDLTLNQQYPEAWQRIVSNEQGHFSNDSGLWYFTTIRPMQASIDQKLASANEFVVNQVVIDDKPVVNVQGKGVYFWKVVSFMPQSDVIALQKSIRSPFYIGMFLGVFLILMGAFYLASAKVARQEALVKLKETNKILDNTAKQLEKDIVAKEVAQQSLEESVERYSGVLSASMDGFVLMNRDGLILECNQALFDILNIETNVIEGSLLADLFDGEQHQKVADSIAHIFESGYRKFEVECIRENVKYFTEVSLMPVQVTEQVCAFMRDITPQKENEFQLEMAASVFTHANEGIFLTDSSFLIIDVNDEFEFITGYLRNTAVGKPPTMLDSSKQSAEFYLEMKTDLLEKGHWYGEIWSRRKTGELFLAFLNVARVQNPHDSSSHYVWMFNDITLEKQYQKRLLNSAHYDQLTNLPNRFLLNDLIQQAIVEAKRNAHCVAVVFIDLDGFKAINDTFGHDMGDKLLVNVAKQMKEVLRATDTVARIGGDEFVAVIGALHKTEEAIPVIQKLLNAVAIPVTKAEQVLQVSGSLGVTFYPQAEGLDGEQLIRQADQAMYQAKQSGKNGYHLFDTEKDALNRDLIRNLNNVEQGLLNDEFVLHYQPKVSLFSDEVIGVEALIRWQHSENGLLYPGDFLPCVENTQLAIKMTEWVVHKALKQIERWQQQGITLAISVNIGAMELQKPNFVEWVTGLLDEYPGISRSMLEFEVLETSALEDVRTVQELIQACKLQGISFALDDFGTGFASLSYLKRLSIETIKIDQSFIRNMFDEREDLTLLEGLIGLTKSLNRKVIAEGIETEEQGEMLIKLGCHFGQGYFIAKPMESKRVPAFLSEWKRPQNWVNQVTFAEQDKA